MPKTPPVVFPEPPTAAALAEARHRLDEHNAALNDLIGKIALAEEALKRTIAEQHAVIQALQDERASLEDTIEHTRGYVAPIRRLPREILSNIFILNFEALPCSAWVLAAVCSLWRRIALGMPRLWSKIRLVTTPTSSADTIRLWLERSGSREPLDIEIFLQAQRDTPSVPHSTRHRQRSPSPWTHHNTAPLPTTHYVQIHTGSAQNTSIQIIPATAPVALPALPPSPTPHDSWGILSPPPAPPPITYPSPSSASTSARQSRSSTHWGHVAVFYLVEQMHRWERFIFRFDKPFPSWDALKSIAGPAPMLKEFEVSCAEPVYYGDWRWLPSATTNTPVVLPNLRTLTLSYAPFKWSSPMLRNNLRSLTLRSLPTTNIALDRILHIAASNKNLEELTLHFGNVLSPVLPLSSVNLPELASLNIGGHYLMIALLDELSVPSLESLILDVEARDPIEDNICQLLSRSGHPPVQHLALAYGTASGMPYYYNSGGLVGSWAFLSDLAQLRTLQVGAAPLDPLFTALGAPDDDGPGGSGGGAGNWLCPQLSSLALKTCPAHPDGVPKLVQMIEGRNPDGTPVAQAPVKLRRLEMIECTTVGQDVIDWLHSRIEEVVCVEPSYESRTPHSPTYAYL